ncbi:FAD-dependent oxidoreductase [Saccharopolyspora sp. K220]|uniref:NAD(P)/FAD-dependent oxidoreductase n=1 Tax=Saccharopolyspora soli TaxID=2926618 RepID=UPI001F58B9B8|nr:FAD-dependent oxidoreductase [Saccharopolyspora soli]MCI2418359.1 FAD-dependent oxidoreductase [Saccharopolyspora soli]
MRTVIVGSSVGGVRTAQALRGAGYDGDVVLVGQERVLPYDKPPLSKSLLAGTNDRAGITLLSESAAAEAGIRLELGCAATRLDLDGSRVELADGRRLEFDDVVIATGARARPSPWGRPPGLHVLRTLDDAEALRADLRRGGPLVVIGAGFIGAEVAATAREIGIEDVSIVDPQPVPMSRALDPAVAARFAALHRERGVATRFGVGVRAIDESGGSLVVRLTDGSALAATTVVVGIGAIPDVEWLRSSGLRIDDGLVCDQYSRALDAPHVHGVGDVARWFHPGHGRLVRVEHWTNAVEQAACVAHNITQSNNPRVHAPVEYVWSDQYDWKFQLAGRTGNGLAAHFVAGADPRSFAVLYADSDGRLAGAATINWPRALVACRRALHRDAHLDDVRSAVAPTTHPGAPIAR